jgi:uncharacterized integral membrane protein (TIGR00698 family)
MNIIVANGMGSGPRLKTGSVFLLAAGLVYVGSPGLALLAGLVLALLLNHPVGRWHQPVAKGLLQVCVVLLGFGVDLPVVLQLGLRGSLLAACTIAATLGLGWWLGRRLKLERKTTLLIASGTAICGGSAIAAVSTVIAATEAEIAVSLGTVFLLNAVALAVFPPLGHWLHLSQPQFGLWAGVAIHDISSVVGAGLSYGTEALNTATAVKLSRTLWIVPLTLGLAFALGRNSHFNPAPGTVAGRPHFKTMMPWFIGCFLLASLLRSALPAVTAWLPLISSLARRGLVLGLFLIGTSLSVRTLRAVGWRAAVLGILLWGFISGSSLLGILFLNRAD